MKDKKIYISFPSNEFDKNKLEKLYMKIKELFPNYLVCIEDNNTYDWILECNGLWLFGNWKDYERCLENKYKMHDRVLDFSPDFVKSYSFYNANYIKGYEEDKDISKKFPMAVFIDWLYKDFYKKE